MVDYKTSGLQTRFALYYNNTYLHEGRPPTPICNPGLVAIRAAIHPEETEYLYYLHDSEGQIHLAKTYEEHLENIEKFLK